MTLPSGAHVKLGAYEFMLAEDEQQHYVHRLSTLSSQRQEIAGEIAGGQLLDPELVAWSYTDWSGGEGNQFYNPSEPTKYDHGGLDARMQGFLTNRPARTEVTQTTSVAMTRVRMAVGAGTLWLMGGQNLWKSTNGTGWATQSISTITGLAAGWTLRAIAGDSQYVYLLAHDTPGGVGKCRIIRIDQGGNQELFYSNDTCHDSFGIALLRGRLYRWTGLVLREYDTTRTGLPIGDANPTTQADYTGYEAPASPDFPAYGDVCAGDNLVVYFSGNVGTGQVYIYQDGVPRPLWTLPLGFTPRSICVQDGVVYVGGSLDNRNTLYAMSLVTRQEVMIAKVRPWRDRQIIFIAPGPASSIIFGGKGGIVYQYDAQLDSVTGVDYSGDWQEASEIDAQMYLDRRVIAWRDDSTHIIIHSFGVDEVSSSTIDNLPLYMPAWDFGYPTCKKIIVGVEVLYKNINAGESFDIGYCLEEENMYPGWDQDPTAGAFTLLGTVTGPTGTDELHRKYIPVSDATTTISAFISRWRLRMTGAIRIYRFTVFAYIAEYVEWFDLLLRVAQEDTDPGARRTRPRGQQRPQEEIRESLLELVRNKKVITFLDGYGYSKRKEGTYDTYPRCVMEMPADEIRSLAEGVFQVRIRNLAR